MGINNFFKIIAKSGVTFGSLGAPMSLKELEGYTLAIDASYVIYNSATAAELSHAGQDTSYLNIILKKILMWKRSKIELIWVFDNPLPNPLKRERVSSGHFTMTSEHVQNVQELLRVLGQMYVVAPVGVEAEHLGATLVQLGVCNYVFSGDSDVLMFGGNLLVPEKGKSGKYIAYDYDKFMEGTKLSRDELLRCGVIMGCDFCVKTPNIGEKTVVKKMGGVELSSEQEIAIAEFNRFPELGEHTKGTLDLAAAEEFLTKRGFGHYDLSVLTINYS